MKIVLGTALWGWSIEKANAWSLMDRFYEYGGRLIDCAENYPINKNNSDFGQSKVILRDWCHAHGIHDLQVIQKVGATQNNGSQDCNLSKDYLTKTCEQLISEFGSNLYSVMIHWDNRNDQILIAETAKTLRDICQKNQLQIGLSGIAHPSIYATALEGIDTVWIETKYNWLQTKTPSTYEAFGERANFFIYGVTLGGLRLDTSYKDSSSAYLRGIDPNTDLSPIRDFIQSEIVCKHPAAPRNVTEFGLLFGKLTLNPAGVILGASNLDQLNSSLTYLEQLEKADLSALIPSLPHPHIVSR